MIDAPRPFAGTNPAQEVQILKSLSRLRPASLALGFAMTLSMPVAAGIVDGMPDTIVCSVSDPTGQLPWSRLVYYVSAQMNDGRTLFKTLTSDPVVLLVSSDGVVEGKNLADCDGKTVSELREQGRALDLVSAN